MKIPGYAFLREIAAVFLDYLMTWFQIFVLLVISSHGHYYQEFWQ
jgi:hypothetical protein